MGYRRAEEILPIEIIELIQQYVDGTISIFQESRRTGRSGGSGPTIEGNCKNGIRRFTGIICPAPRHMSWQKATIYLRKAYNELSDRKNNPVWADLVQLTFFLKNLRYVPMKISGKLEKNSWEGERYVMTTPVHFA